MKLVNLLPAVALSVGLAACSKQENPAPPAQSESAPKAATEAAAPAVAAAQDAATSTAAQAQALIEKAQALLADTKYGDAANVLKELSAMKLTPEQKRIVDDLTAQVQKALAGAAASDASKKASDAVGGLLGK
jgi:outer membrane PBP1 activator LpoA protein